ncbi:MAG: hypothetical protein K9I34_04770 [Bacteroidales bacterium]|nr:hypothetical protein [Bacteroidales bacterium]
MEDYTPAAIILKSKGYNEGTRDNHGGGPLNTVSPTSTQTRREARKEAKQKQ